MTENPYINIWEKCLIPVRSMQWTGKSWLENAEIICRTRVFCCVRWCMERRLREKYNMHCLVMTKAVELWWQQGTGTLQSFAKYQHVFMFVIWNLYPRVGTRTLMQNSSSIRPREAISLGVERFVFWYCQKMRSLTTCNCGHWWTAVN